MKTLNLIQGSPDWAAARAQHFCASEAPAMMGASKFTSRTELLRHKATGTAPEVSGARQALYDRGHATEASARPIVEELIGDDLSAVTAVSDCGQYLASLDGLTLMGDTVFEHKLWSESLAEQVRSGVLDMHYVWQLEHQLMVTGAERAIFATSDGTREKFTSMEYRPVPGRREQLIAGWKQFAADLADYVPPAAAEVVHAAPIEALPAVSVQMQGSLTVHSNLDVFGRMLREFIGKIPAKPSSEQEFADCDAACKALKRAEEALDGAEANALGQVQSVEQITRTIADLRTVARTARLASEKMVKARKEQIRSEEVQRGRTALAEFIAGLNTTIGRPYMPIITADFAGVISGKKTVDSVRNAIDTELARAKIAATEVSNTIIVNLRALRELAADHTFLFADVASIVLKPCDDCLTLIKSRIAEHKAAEEKKEAARREEIRQEELARIQRDQQAARQAELRREQQAAEAAKPASAVAAIAAPAPVAAPAPQAAAANSPTVVPLRAPSSLPTLKLGDINARLEHFTTSEAGLAALGFPATHVKGARLYHEADFSRMVDSMVAHLRMVCEQRQAA